jgi:hypothetical protein
LGIAHILSFTISFENNSSSVCFKDQLWTWGWLYRSKHVVLCKK